MPRRVQKIYGIAVIRHPTDPETTSRADQKDGITLTTGWARRVNVAGSDLRFRRGSVLGSLVSFGFVQYVKQVALP